MALLRSWYKHAVYTVNYWIVLVQLELLSKMVAKQLRPGLVTNSDGTCYRTPVNISVSGWNLAEWRRTAKEVPATPFLNVCGKQKHDGLR